MHLLCTLGSSFAVVPEAYLMGNGDDCYESVTVLTTSGTAQAVEKCHDWFVKHAPECSLRILVTEDLPDIANAADHNRFEEALFRVYANLFSQHGVSQLHLCLAGGFKTTSSAAHQAADLFGCAKLFHITAPNSTGEHPTPRGIFAAIEADLTEKRLHPYLKLVDLGHRPGWPTIQELCPEAPALPEAGDSFPVPNTGFQEKVQNRLREANRLSQSEHELATLPFPQIARWSPAARGWLQQALDPASDRNWVASLPKVELHCHLGGFATHGKPLEQVREAATYPENLPPIADTCAHPKDWPLPQEPIGLENYRQLGDNNGSKLLQDPGCLKKHIELLYQHFQEQNIHYAEVRCSPANYASEGRSPWTVLTDIIDFFQVAASVPLDGQNAAASVPLEGHAHSRQFHPFDPNAPFTQPKRNLPHRKQSGTTSFVTFRLPDSIPSDKADQWKQERDAFVDSHPEPWDLPTQKEYRRLFSTRLNEWLDRSEGECLLADPEAASIIENALLHFDDERYILDHYVIMPNHVHVLVKPLDGHTLTDILHSWKSLTAKTINSLLGRHGKLWQHESFDHLVRGARQLEKIRKYIADNPAAAHLTKGYRLGQGIGLMVAPSVPLEGPSTEANETFASTFPSRRRPVATKINLIIIATRQTKGDFRTGISKHLALAAAAADHWIDPEKPRVVGVDLAGYESQKTRAHYFREEFAAAHRAGLGITVHAGENDDAEGIWSAILDLNARRLGHALHLKHSPTLLQTVADRGIGIEMCPYANYQIVGFRPMEEKEKYPLPDYLRAGVPVTVNTDNIGISDASLTANLLLLPKLCPGITRLEILRLLRNSIDQAFLSFPEQSRILAEMKIELPTSPPR